MVYERENDDGSIQTNDIINEFLLKDVMLPPWFNRNEYLTSQVRWNSSDGLSTR